MAQNDAGLIVASPVDRAVIYSRRPVGVTVLAVIGRDHGMAGRNIVYVDEGSIRASTAAPGMESVTRRDRGTSTKIRGTDRIFEKRADAHPPCLMHADSQIQIMRIERRTTLGENS